jgi:uncharacterized repeat protein (TIGR03803 family)
LRFEVISSKQRKEFEEKMESKMQSDHSHAPAVATLFAAAILLLLSASSALASGPLKKTLYSFQGGSDGGTPVEGLIADKDGNLYGTTALGGGSSACPSGCGTVFELIPPTTPGGAWTETQLQVFQGVANEGDTPVGPLAFDKSGNLYGVTSGEGGVSNGGTVFELSPPAAPGGSWTETVLHIFPLDGSTTNGPTPRGGLIFDGDGNLYGVTVFGGLLTACSGNPCGTVFELSPPASVGGNWTETTIYEFQGTNDGFWPQSGLIFDRTGALYGTTTSSKNNGGGAVFQLVRSHGAWSVNILYSFASEVGNPVGALIFDTHGNLYGTALGGIVNCTIPRCGSIFELTPPSHGDPWTEKTLYSFTRGLDGAYPVGHLTMDKAGNLYGVTEGGGIKNQGAQDGNGAVFELSPPTVSGGPWTETTLHDFARSAPGEITSPTGGLIMVSGKFYGATNGGGSTACEFGCGTVYSLVIVP